MPLLYFHQTSCISPQQIFPPADAAQVKTPVANKLEVAEPEYQDIPPGILRRMGKAIRIGVGAAMPLLKKTKVDGIIIGTANGGMEDCIKFLNQIIDYDEGRLTPGNFVGSTPNAIAAQLGLLTANKGYNITHVQSGLSFENALLDAAMMIAEKKDSSYLVGGLDEISAYNYNIDMLGGWFKKENNSNAFYESETPGSIAGEGAAMFIVNGEKQSATAQLDDIHFFHTEDENELVAQLTIFLEKNANSKPDILLTGENGDNRFVSFTNSIESCFEADITIARFKHLTGEYPTAAALACYAACEILKSENLPAHMIKKQDAPNDYKSMLIYNFYKGTQHSFILISKPL